MKIRYGCAVLLWLVPFFSRSQYFSTGEDPAFLKWRQIVTRDFQLIYPAEFEEKARLMAAYFEKVYDYGSVTLHHRPRKISVIFHTRTVQSNGLVGWAPRRMELYTPPHQATYAQDWLEQLALHEFRHVVQVDKIHSQIPWIVKALLGEQGDALITGLFLPFWFIEGDAVISETALSDYGRGRLPSFLMEYKALLTEKGRYSFDKAVNGSFRDFVPDHYKLGYLLVGESRLKYGAELWNKVINQLAGKPYSIVPVNRILKKETGMNQEKLYNSVFDNLTQKWQKEDQLFVPENFRIITKPSKNFQEYIYNHYLPSGEIISLKTGLDEIPHFVKIDSLGNEWKVYTPGKIFDESVGYRNNLIVWSELVPDVRWSHSGKSIIRIYDLEKRHIKSISPEYKCFAPAISPDEHNVAVVETDFGNRYYLTVYDAINGALVTRFQTPDNNYLYCPVWKNNKEIFVVALTRQGKQLARIKPFTKEMEWLPFVNMGDIKQLCVKEDKLYFVGDYAGKDELYSVNTSTNEISREVRARFGVQYPSFSAGAGKLVISDYTSSGFRLVELDLNKVTNVSIDKITNVTYELADSLALQEPGKVDFAEADTTGIHSKPYRKGLNLINFHSWAPLNIDAGTYEIEPGISISSQNKLGTSEITAGYRFSTKNIKWQRYVSFEYRGWFPVLSSELKTGINRDDITQITITKNNKGEVIKQDTVTKQIFWKQSDINLGMRIPFNFTSGKFYRLFQPEISYNYSFYEHEPSTPEKFVKGRLQSLAWRLSYYQQYRQSHRDIQPRWGWISNLTYRHTLDGDHDLGNLLCGEMKLFLPGIAQHHGFSYYAGVQKRNRGEYGFGDILSVPVGWRPMNSNIMICSTVKYAFPLFYPDWHADRLLYLRRIRAAFFYQHAWLEGDVYQNGAVAGTFRKSMSSLGLDLSANCNFLRFYAPFEIGARTSYLPGLRKMAAEFLLSVDFTSF
jgi:hypothetical protein